MDNKLRIAICDDQAIILEHLEKMVDRILAKSQITYHINTYISPMNLLNAAEVFDLIFLDIEMPEIDGLTLSNRLRYDVPDTKIVIISNHREYVQEGYKVHAMRYLYKPLLETDVEEVLKSFLASRDSCEGICLPCDKKDTYIHLREIIFLESLGDGCAIYLTSQILITMKPLASIMAALDSRFSFCHRSYIVNMDCIVQTDYTANVIYMINSKTVPISLRRKKAFREQYLNHIQKNARYL